MKKKNILKTCENKSSFFFQKKQEELILYRSKTNQRKTKNLSLLKFFLSLSLSLLLSFSFSLFFTKKREKEKERRNLPIKPNEGIKMECIIATVVAAWVVLFMGPVLLPILDVGVYTCDAISLPLVSSMTMVTGENEGWFQLQILYLKR